MSEPTKAQQSEDDQWHNVMVEDFTNPKFNSYLERQPGSHVLADEGNVSRVYIQNVPASWSMQAIQSLCKEYGCVVRCNKPPNQSASRCYCFVEFGSPAEAQRCIEEINNKSKSMRASFAHPRKNNHRMPLPPASPERKVTNAPNTIVLSNRAFKGPMSRPSVVTFPETPIPLSVDEYKVCENIDPQRMFYNEKALCDFLHSEIDLPVIIEVMQDYTWAGGFWVLKSEEKLANLAKRHTDVVKNDILMHGKPMVPIKSCKLCGKRTLYNNDDGGLCSTKCTGTQKIGSSIEFQKIAENSAVIITSVINQGTVYVRPEKLNESYQKLIFKVIDACRSSKQLDKVKPGELVAVKTSSMFYRALVLKVTKNSARVAFIDTGAVSFQSTSDLFELPVSVKFLPVHINKVVLSQVPAECVNIRAIAILNKLNLGLINWDLCVKWTSESLEGTLTTISGDSVNKLLSDIIEIKEPDPIKYDGPHEEDIKQFVVSIESPTPIRIVDNSFLDDGIVAVILDSHLTKLEEIHKQVNAYGNKLTMTQPYCPSATETCIFRCNDIWFRAVCKETAGDQHPTLFAIDYGFYTIANIKDISPLPVELVDQLPCLTELCNIRDFEPFITADRLQQAQQKVDSMKLVVAEKMTFDEDANHYFIESQELLDLISPFGFFSNE